MDFEELWVGDKIYVKSLGVTGLWDSKKNNEIAILSINGVKREIPLSDLSEHVESKSADKSLLRLEEELRLENKTKASKISESSDYKIDLHIEKLNLKLIDSDPIQIKNHQLMRCKVFVDDAIERRSLMVKVIHGKGEGILKKEIKNMLGQLPELQKIEDAYDEGALIIWLNY